MIEKETFSSAGYFSVFATILGSLLFGYQTAVVSGALIFFSQEFALTAWQEGWAVCILLLGALAGVLLSGTLADRFGRKAALGLLALLFAAGTSFVYSAASFEQFMFGRMVTGLGVGLISMIGPLYLAEIAPAKFRGRVVAVHQLLVTFGILLSYFVNYLYAPEGNWRAMFGFSFIPIALQLVSVPFIIESPAWQFSKKKEKVKEPFINNEMVKAYSVVKEKGDWKALFSPSFRHLLVIGIVLNVFQQITGINTVIYFAPKILQLSGLDSLNVALLSTFGIGLINFFATILSVWLLDRLGRKILLFGGIAGMIINLALLSFVFFFPSSSSSVFSIVCLIGFVASFAVGFGPVPNLLIAEIYPVRLRGKGMGLATAANWFCNSLLSLTFLDLVGHIGIGSVFSLFALLAIFSLAFVYYKVPETKGRTLEEIEKTFS
jgi:MFS transporter, SP family, galactose:H+ symporter